MLPKILAQELNNLTEHQSISNIIDSKTTSDMFSFKPVDASYINKT